MGAFGAALIARERFEEGYQTTMLPMEKINTLQFETSMAKCRGCTNNCRLTINKFTGGRQFISGNRCERGIGGQKNENGIPNLFDYKLKRFFDYEPLPADRAPRGRVGIPRVLNLYENYPFWFTFFTALDFQVVLSGFQPEDLRAWYRIHPQRIRMLSRQACTRPYQMAH